MSGFSWQTLDKELADIHSCKNASERSERIRKLAEQVGLKGDQIQTHGQVIQVLSEMRNQLRAKTN